MDGDQQQSEGLGVSKSLYMRPGYDYLVVDPTTCQISSNREFLLKYAHKMFVSLFRKEPEECFWCYGYDVVYAGPIPTVTRLWTTGV